LGEIGSGHMPGQLPTARIHWLAGSEKLNSKHKNANSQAKFEKTKMINNKQLEEQIATNNKKKREKQKKPLRMTNPYINPSFNPSHPKTNILTSPNSNPNPTRNEVIKPDRTGKYVLKLPRASRNKYRKLDQKKKQTLTKTWIKISETRSPEEHPNREKKHRNNQT
jgi:hypothetical protein